MDIKWDDDGLSPSADSFTSLTVVLCTGSNSNIQAVLTIASGISPDSKSYSASIPVGVGASGVYFIQLYAVYPSGYSIHYTSRFELDSMTGSVKPTGLLNDNAPPAVQKVNNNGANNDGEATNTLTLPADISKSFTVPYPQQTGLIKFAPMQSQPGLTVTKLLWSRKYPTSAVTYYTTRRASLDCLSTVTPGWNYDRISLPNGASPAENPTSVGSWYPATKNLVKPTKTGAPRFN